MYNFHCHKSVGRNGGFIFLKRQVQTSVRSTKCVGGCEIVQNLSGVDQRSIRTGPKVSKLHDYWQAVGREIMNERHR